MDNLLKRLKQAFLIYIDRLFGQYYHISMSTSITEKQKNVLEAIYNSLESANIPPTLAEIRQSIGVKSNQVILDILKALENKGCIKRDQRKARKITILPLGFNVLGKKQEIPLLGVSAAGPFIESLDSIATWFSLPGEVLKNEQIKQSKEEFFAIQVQGDSMINAGIDDGDILLVQKTNQFKSGNIVVARNDDGTTVKRFISESDGRAYLKPENPKYKNLTIYEDTYFDGRVILNLTKAEKSYEQPKNN